MRPWARNEFRHDAPLSSRLAGEELAGAGGATGGDGTGGGLTGGGGCGRGLLGRIVALANRRASRVRCAGSAGGRPTGEKIPEPQQRAAVTGEGRVVLGR
jgi:hypothetical protein